MTAYTINEQIKNFLPFWEIDSNGSTDAENIAHIQTLIDAGLMDLFDAMKNDICVMAEHDDSETSLLYELITADADIINEYKEIFL